MTDNGKHLSDANLDRLFADLAERTPAPSEALLARVLDDAMAARPAPGETRRAGVLATILAAVGGWKGAGGLVTAGLVGLWVGIAPPGALSTEAQTLWSAVSPDMTGGWADYGDNL
jgi:hypothetical protein